MFNPSKYLPYLVWQKECHMFHFKQSVSFYSFLRFSAVPVDSSLHLDGENLPWIQNSKPRNHVREGLHQILSPYPSALRAHTPRISVNQKKIFPSSHTVETTRNGFLALRILGGKAQLWEVTTTCYPSCRWVVQATRRVQETSRSKCTSAWFWRLCVAETSVNPFWKKSHSSYPQKIPAK